MNLTFVKRGGGALVASLPVPGWGPGGPCVRLPPRPAGETSERASPEAGTVNGRRSRAPPAPRFNGLRGLPGWARGRDFRLSRARALPPPPLPPRGSSSGPPSPGMRSRRKRLTTITNIGGGGCARTPRPRAARPGPALPALPCWPRAAFPARQSAASPSLPGRGDRRGGALPPRSRRARPRGAGGTRRCRRRHRRRRMRGAGREPSGECRRGRRGLPPPPPRSPSRPLPTGGGRVGGLGKKGRRSQLWARGCSRGAGDEELGGGGGEDRGPAAGSGPGVAGWPPRSRRGREGGAAAPRWQVAGQRRAGRGARSLPPSLPGAPLPGRGIGGEVTTRNDSARLRLRARGRQRSAERRAEALCLQTLCCLSLGCLLLSAPEEAYLVCRAFLSVPRYCFLVDFSGRVVDPCWHFFLSTPKVLADTDPEVEMLIWMLGKWNELIIVTPVFLSWLHLEMEKNP